MSDDARAADDGADLTPAVRRVADGEEDAGTEWADLTPAVRRVGEDDAGAGTEWGDLEPAVRRVTETGTAAGADDRAVDAGSDAEPSGVQTREPSDVPQDVREYERFSKIDGSTYERANEFLRDRTYITAREWAMARLCADFRTETGVEMTKIGENLPELVPFMTDTYSPQAVNQARSSFDDKVRKAGATFLYGAMCDFYTAEELDDLMYEITEVAKFLLEVEGVELTVDEELEAEERISTVMREVRESSAALRHDECPNCGHELRAGERHPGHAADEPADD